MNRVDTHQNINHAQRYFTEFLPTLLDRLMVENLSSLNAAFQIRLIDQPGEAWDLVIASGRLTQATRAGSAPEMAFALDTDTLMRIVRGEESPQDAFFAMRVEIEGDVELGLKLSTVLECFFERFPFLE